MCGVWAQLDISYICCHFKISEWGCIFSTQQEDNPEGKSLDQFTEVLPYII